MLYDVFLSHNSADKEWVEKLAHLLKDKHELTPFLDKWHLIPGNPWQQEIAAALDDSQTFAVFVGENGIGPWEHEEMQAALDKRVNDPGRRVIPVLLPNAHPKLERELPTFLRNLTWVDFRRDFDYEFRRLVAGIKDEAPGAPDIFKDKGELLHLLLNRTVEEDQFDVFVRLPASSPVAVCWIFGSEDDCPEHLTERLTVNILRQYAKDRWTDENAIDAKLLEWPDGEVVTNLYGILLTRLFREMEILARTGEPGDFAAHMNDGDRKIYVLRYEIEAGAFERHKRFFRKYLTFWQQVRNSIRTDSRVIIFFSIIFPGGREMRGAYQDSLVKQAQALMRPLTRKGESWQLIFSRLSCVSPMHVRNWFRKHTRFDESQWKDLRREIFGDADCLPMNDVGAKLKGVQDQHTKGRW